MTQRQEPPKGPTVKVNFVILKSPHGHEDQLIVPRECLLVLPVSYYSRGVIEEINSSTTVSEIIWRFSRYPKNSPARFTHKQNPHFYLQLPSDAASYDSEFKRTPVKDFTHSLSSEDTIYVLLDKSCRLFLDAAQPRIFGNLWKPHLTVILKGEYSPRYVACLTHVDLRCHGKSGVRRYCPSRHWGQPRLLASTFQSRRSFSRGTTKQ